MADITVTLPDGSARELAAGSTAADLAAAIGPRLAADALALAPELDRVAHMEGTLLGINNRDLRTFETRLETTTALLDQVPEGRRVITESGIHTPEDVALMREHGVHAFLVGEAFMRADEPGEELRELFFPTV